MNYENVKKTRFYIFFLRVLERYLCNGKRYCWDFFYEVSHILCAHFQYFYLILNSTIKVIITIRRTSLKVPLSKKEIIHKYTSVETNSVNIWIIDCYTNYSNISEVFEYSVLSHALNVITRAQQTKQVQAMAKRFWSL